MKLLLTLLLLILPMANSFAHKTGAPQTAAPTTPTASTPETVVKDFYRWYIDRLNKNKDPLTQEKTALKRYITPEFFKKAPKLLEQTDADVFICAQDWDKDWGKNVRVSRLNIQGAGATLNVLLASKEKTMNHRLKIKLKQVEGVWKIDKIDPLDL
jgi:hypothetical protein